jgi:ABC-type multidrug transport system fused ATPase/permease subunit
VIYLILAGPSRTSPGAFTEIIGAVASLNMQVLILAMRLHDLDEQAVFLHDVQQFLDLPPLLHVRQPALPLPDLRTSAVRFEDVTFTYPTGHAPALCDFSLELRPGELLAIVGDNGGGKSTMVKLLLRFYDPQQGRITVGGVDLRDLDPVAWRRSLGVLFQDYARLQLTVRDAVQAGRPWETLTDDAVHAALRSSQADDVLLDLPNGLDSRVGNLFPGGHELSGGQWQRLALARLVARDAAIWVLDEPTSALDPEAEAAVFGELPALLHGRIGVIISHRFSTVRNADRIAVIRNGGIAELGSHEELMAAEGEYAGLFRLQAAGYV